MKTNYLKYAIGEIVLVVIGIFIAIQLNGWYEYKKEQKEELFYLEKLRVDFISDIENIDLENKKLDSYLKGIEQIIADYEMGKAKFSLEIGMPMSATATMLNQTATWDNLIATGKIKLINNKELVESIYTYHNKFNDQTIGMMNAMTSYSRNEISPFLMAFDDISFSENNNLINKYPTLSKSPKAYFEQVEFRNYIRFRVILIGLLKEYYLENKEKAENIIALIDSLNENH
jgi:uncharacterized protein DUF6090